MKILERKYLNKAYSAKIIINQSNESVPYSFLINTFDSSYVKSLYYSSWAEMILGLQDFYIKIGLPMPKEEDITPTLIKMSETIFIRYIDGKYNISASRYNGGSAVILIKGLEYQEAMNKAREIITICGEEEV